MKVHTPLRLKTRRALSRKALLGIASLTAAASSLHADATWVGGTSNDWNLAANWSSSPSNPTGNFTLNLATGNYPVMNATSAFTPTDVLIGSATGQTGRFDQTAGSMSLAVIGANGNWFKVGQSGGTGTYNLADTSVTGQSGITTYGQGSGSLTVGKFFVGGAYFASNGTGTVNINTSGTLTAQSTQSFTADGTGGQNASIVVSRGTGSGTLNLENGTVVTAGDFWVGNIGTGTVNQTGGTVNVGGLLLLSRNNNNTQAGVGTWNVSGTGVANIQNDLVVAYAGNSSATGAMNINAGGTVNVATTTERWVIVNRFDSIKGQLTVDGGTLNMNANVDLRFSTGNGVGTSFATVKNGGSIVGGAGSVVDLMNANVAGNNTFNLDGGTLTISQVISTNNSGTAVFNFNGGVLKATLTTANFVDLGGAGQTAVVKSGGAFINSNGFNVTIPQALLDGTGGGGLTKSGAGTLTLSAANTYTGATVVNAGTLALASAGSLASTSFSIGNGATFDTSAKASFDLSGVATTIGLDASTGGFFNAGSGALTVGNSLSLNFSTASLVGGTAYNLFDFGSRTGDFSSVNLTGSISSSLARSGSLWTGTSGSFGFSFDESNGVLTVTAVPEPSTCAALFGALALGASAVRRRRRG